MIDYYKTDFLVSGVRFRKDYQSRHDLEMGIKKMVDDLGYIITQMQNGFYDDRYKIQCMNGVIINVDYKKHSPEHFQIKGIDQVKVSRLYETKNSIY